MDQKPAFDVILIGGSYAGLSAAMALGRSLRKILVIDSGKPCNAQTPHSHNFLTHDGKTPAAIAKEAKHQLLQYASVEFYYDTAIDAQKTDIGFRITTATGKNFTSKKILIATGVRDIMPDFKGFAECWGISILHCPYCHGYEVRNTEIGILANGPLGFEMGRLISNWTDKLTIFTNGISTFDEFHLERFEAHKIKIDERTIDYFEHDKGYLKKIHFKDGTTHSINTVFARPDFEQHSDLAKKLGCEFKEDGLLHVDEFQNTTAHGISAAGDCTTPFRSVAAAVAAGNKAGAILNRQLIEELF